jgi:hypothetical protein
VLTSAQIVHCCPKKRKAPATRARALRQHGAVLLPDAEVVLQGLADALEPNALVLQQRLSLHQIIEIRIEHPSRHAHAGLLEMLLYHIFREMEGVT